VSLKVHKNFKYFICKRYRCYNTTQEDYLATFDENEHKLTLTNINEHI